MNKEHAPLKVWATLGHIVSRPDLFGVADLWSPAGGCDPRAGGARVKRGGGRGAPVLRNFSREG